MEVTCSRAAGWEDLELGEEPRALNGDVYSLAHFAEKENLRPGRGVWQFGSDESEI